ncbi:MAG: glycosyltransferase [Bacteroidetes bacterium]|nr:glycosyltransferase [Bacteroidota bacterium]
MFKEWFIALVSTAFYAGITYFIHRNFKKLRNQQVINSNGIKISDLTIIVPFRNEEKCISQLINCFNEIAELPLVVFIDDHSEDASRELIQEKSDFNFQLIRAEKTGKKNALVEAMTRVETPFVVTLDADVVVPKTYFESICRLEQKDISILPVEMTSKNWISSFYRWEYQLQRVAWASYGFAKQPITGSGANLLFRKSAYEEINSYRNDWHLASGDDHFLIQEAVKQKYSVQLVEQADLTVKTPAPSTFFEGLNQRARWLGKTQFQPNTGANGFAILLLIGQVLIYSSIIFLLLHQYYWLALGVLLVKTDLDGWITTYKFMNQETTFKVWLFELFYPIYLLFLIGFFLFVTPDWKGRKTKKP